jgi:hypothetical protein
MASVHIVTDTEYISEVQGAHTADSVMSSHDRLVIRMAVGRQGLTINMGGTGILQMPKVSAFVEMKISIGEQKYLQTDY